ncbi:MAG: hypothetical protein V1897_02400 [Pseudomonadota bacterium]
MSADLKKIQVQGGEVLDRPCNSPEPEPCPMVSWLSPKQLALTAVNVAISAALGTRADMRMMQAQMEGPHFIDYEFCNPEDDFWFDYMADTGDGWEPTLSMASLLTQESLTTESSGTKYVLPRGKFLVLGGDEVYPYASKLQYKNRLVGPFEYAKQSSVFSKIGEAAHMFAIPGNHDWYDGLVSFMRQFQQNRHIGIWKTNQKRSYFALKLPHRWWLWGIDTQLESDIDWPQVKFFQKVAKSMDDHDRLILCTAEPYWIYAELYKDKDLDNNLNFLLGQKVLGDKRIHPYLCLSGDLHIYRRHQDVSDTNRHKIVSGGGGAFSHPTHNGRVESITLLEADPSRARESGKLVPHLEKSGPDMPQGESVTDITASPENNPDEIPCVLRTYMQAADQFPPEQISRRLAWRNLILGYYNPTFGVVTAILYVILGWALTSSTATFLVGIVLTYFIGWAFCDALIGRFFRHLWGGMAHGMAHLAAVCSLSFIEHMVSNRWAFLGDVVLYPLIVGTGGYILGPVILGAYLLVSLNCFSVHHNEAFSSLRNPNYKNFLRVNVAKNGTLTIYPVGVTTPKSPPILIEQPIAIEPEKPGDSGAKI